MTCKEPKGVTLDQYCRIGGMLVTDNRITITLELMGQHIAPLLLQALQFLGSHRADGSMTGEEILTKRLWFLGESNQILRDLILIAATTIEIIHHHIFFAVVQLEHTTAFHMRSCAGIGIKVLEVLLPRTSQVLRCGLLDAVDILFSILILRITFIEKMIQAVFIDDIIVDASIFR